MRTITYKRGRGSNFWQFLCVRTIWMTPYFVPDPTPSVAGLTEYTVPGSIPNNFTRSKSLSKLIRDRCNLSKIS